MRKFAVPRKDGGVTILTLVPIDGVYLKPAEVMAKWHPDTQAEHDGEPVEIDGIPDKDRAAWKLADGKVVIDAAKKAEIDARPKPLTLEQRVAALERR